MLLRWLLRLLLLLHLLLFLFLLLLSTSDHVRHDPAQLIVVAGAHFYRWFTHGKLRSASSSWWTQTSVLPSSTLAPSPSASSHISVDGLTMHRHRSIESGVGAGIVGTGIGGGGGGGGAVTTVALADTLCGEFPHGE